MDILQPISYICVLYIHKKVNAIIDPNNSLNCTNMVIKFWTLKLQLNQTMGIMKWASLLNDNKFYEKLYVKLPTLTGVVD